MPKQNFRQDKYYELIIEMYKLSKLDKSRLFKLYDYVASYIYASFINNSYIDKLSMDLNIYDESCLDLDIATAKLNSTFTKREIISLRNKIFDATLNTFYTK